ncbi:FAD-dependent oxidoreductase [Gulosibacter molinativorax]|uniref:FAD-dependent oxidoreductase n=1 Tax=Gulosibacter molinativorax TaxID=256821 RepID=UPI001B7F927F|nr:FAD-dependent oxidoreductase [Gulosibacter molinativorax]
MARRVTVIGAGVIGLSVAHEFASNGDEVTVVADQDTMETVSSVSAALWFPFRSERSELADQLLARSLERFVALTAESDAVVRMRTGTVVERLADPDRSWTSHLAQFEEASAAQLPEGTTSGVRAALPFIEIPRYLPWLKARVQSLGITFEYRTVASIKELANESDLVVIAVASSSAATKASTRSVGRSCGSRILGSKSG